MVVKDGNDESYGIPIRWKKHQQKQEPLSYHCLHQVICNITKPYQIDEHESRVERLVTFIFSQHPPTVY